MAPRVQPAAENFILTTMLRDVIRSGTGRRALSLGRSDLAGKTGTTNDQRDAWFSGFNAELAATVWVGFDRPATLGRRETGASAALPIWMEFMRGALAGRPEKPLLPPEGIVTARIDRVSGALAGPGQSDTVFEYFQAGQLPVPSPGAGGSGRGKPAESEWVTDLF
jgi:penicillin-binding protein 1A